MGRIPLFACGALSSVLYLASIDVVAALLYPDYHEYQAQMVSELMAQGAPTQPVMRTAGVLYNTLVSCSRSGSGSLAAGTAR